MLENNIRTVVSIPSKSDKHNSDEEDSDLVKIRKNILSQYAQKEANSEEEECSDLDIEHNTNASSVLALKKEQRERAKEQSLKKKKKKIKKIEKNKSNWYKIGRMLRRKKLKKLNENVEILQIKILV